MRARERAVSKYKLIDKMINSFCEFISSTPRVYLSKAPNEATLPYTTFSIEGVSEDGDKCGVFGVDVSVRFDLYDTKLPDVDVGAFVGGDDVAGDVAGEFVIVESTLEDMSIDKVDTNIYIKSVLVNYKLQHIKG